MAQESNLGDGSSNSLPQHHRALILETPDKPPTVQTVPIPEIQPGTAILRVLTAPIISYTREVYQSSDPNYRKYPFPLPITLGFAAIGEVASVANDATALHSGQLVFFDPLVRGRDFDGTSSSTPAMFLSAVHEGYTDGSRQLMAHGGIRDGVWAQYARVMLENCYILDKDRLTKPRPHGLGYDVGDLCAISTLLVPYGGLRSVDVRPGEVVLISPATGPFGGAACMVVLALGARVIAWGRSVEKLENLKSALCNIGNGRYADMVDVVPMTSDANKDLENIRNISKSGGGGGVDVFFDISPPMAQGSHHTKTGILSLRHSGRVSLMGGFRGDISIPHVFLMHFDIMIKGKWMYDRSDVVELIKLVERGILVIGKPGGWSVEEFELENWKKAWDAAYDKNKIGEMVVFTP